MELDGFCGESIAPLADESRQVRKRRVQELWTEGYLAQYPVNQRIVAGEPIVSKNQGAGQVEQSHIKAKSHGFTRRKSYRKF